MISDTFFLVCLTIRLFKQELTQFPNHDHRNSVKTEIIQNNWFGHDNWVHDSPEVLNELENVCGRIPNNKKNSMEKKYSQQIV